MRRIAVIDKELCNPKKCGLICAKVCPKNRAEERCIFLEEGKVKINESLCIGCNICAKKCPFNAIKIVNLPFEEKNPIFRYGENGFCLFSIPLPQPGKIRGILGANGIGKSTALKILAGLIKPNLKELPRFARIYLEKKREISYKPQILEEVRAEEIKEEVARLLGIKEKPISGGELQKWNIAKCLSKDADLYIIDEPSSYLDIKERLRIAKMLREFLTDKEVIVVDHDLCFLEMLADELFIFYGEKGAYGFCSDVYAVGKGINAFLEGYLKSENIRIRREPILFQRQFSPSESKAEEIVKYSKIEKRLDSFILEVEAGGIKRGRVTGIVGQNSIGKTTFAKLLAGIIKPDLGKIEKNIKIAYKPQYLQSNEKIKVREILPTDKELREGIYLKLGIDNKILEKELCNLSGGELQIVAVALCLSKDADLYLLDEPSAFLDVDQRLNLAKILRRLSEERDKAIVVIDHDILFLDYLCDEIILFLGKPNVKGIAKRAKAKKDALNLFLKELDITIRRDKDTFRPKINKPNSRLDREQKEKGLFFID